MATEMEKARVTELHVRMDCNGCVQKIKKAIYRINGVHDVHVDLVQQKLTVVGRADPENLIKAIKKTKKIAVILSHTDPNASEPPSTEPEASSSGPATEAAEQPPNEPPPPEAQPQENPVVPKSTNQPSDAKKADPKESEDVEEVHLAHHHPQSHVVREQWENYPPMGHQIRYETPYYVTHSYNTYMPPPAVSEYRHIQSPPQEMRYHSMEAYGDGYHQNRRNDVYYQNQGSNRGYYQNQGSPGGYYQNQGGDGNQVTSMFSDENPNACTIV